MHAKGHATVETKEALDRARSLIEQAEAYGERDEDPMLLFSILYGFWVANFIAFKGEVVRDLSAQFLTLADKQIGSTPLMIGHRLVAQSLLVTGEVSEGRTHYDKALALFDPAIHQPLATRFGQDIAVAVLGYRAQALWILGYPDAALADAAQAVSRARAIDHPVTLMHALGQAWCTYTFCRKYAAAETVATELIASANQRSALFWKVAGMMHQASLAALTVKATDDFALTTGTYTVPLHLAYLARAYAQIGKFEEAQCRIDEAVTIIETTGERWHEAEINRIAAEIALESSQTDAAKAEVYFEHALSVARRQQVKSWELRASMSLARLWRSQGKVQQARELLAPVYGWFTEGFNTRDLKDAKALLDELAA
jgi:predicted ATPase